MDKVMIHELHLRLNMKKNKKDSKISILDRIGWCLAKIMQEVKKVRQTQEN